MNMGVAALARECGVDQSTISRRMARGQTVEYIREAIRQQQSRQGTGMGPKARSYTPPRRVVSPPAPTGKKNGNGNGHAPVSRPVEVGEDGEEEYAQRREKLTDAELRLAIAQADEREAKAAILRRDWVPVSQVNFVIGGFHAKFRDRFFRIPSELGDRLAVCTDPVKCTKMVMDALVEAARELKVMTGTGGVQSAPEEEESKE